MTGEGIKVGRRERRAQETRRRILDAALVLFSERGIDAVTVEDVADRADVARATVFNYFVSKESLCCELGTLGVEMLQEAIAAGRVPGPTVGQKLDQALRLLAEFPGRNAENCRQILTRSLAAMAPGRLPEHRVQLFALLEEWVREGQRTGELRADYPSCELAGFILGLQFQATLTWAFEFAHETLPEHTSRVLRLGLEGMKAPKPVGEGNESCQR